MGVLKTKLRKGDTVIVMKGEDKGKKGKILRVERITTKRGDAVTKVIIEGINFVKKHVKPNQQQQQGGIVTMEAPISVSKVMLICDKCSKPTKVAMKFLKDGKKSRACKLCGELI